MGLGAARLSAVRGVIDRRILANYRLDADAAAAVLPAPFKPKLVGGFAIGGLCLIRLKQVRPAILPLPIGIASENAAHRIAVVWEQDGQEREGVYIPRRDTDSRLNALAGGRVFPGEHHHAQFKVEESHGGYDVSFEADDGGCAMAIRARETHTFPDDSVFAGLDAASRFFEAGSLGYSATSRPGRFDGLALDCDRWAVQPLEVEAIRSSFFDDPGRFLEGTVAFDCALLMRGVDHAWHRRGALCCASSESEAVAHG
jgi:hypothetical protein